ncbi:MAG TPA: trimethylamine corrinoid protein 2 [Clostridiaceae bacterium]|nr:trimethylamine corrinoid protein 2 [Clostridiaceae bacterium]
MKYKDNWQETRQRMNAWWKGESMDRPMMRIVARRKEAVEPLEEVEPYANMEEKWLHPGKTVANYMNYCRQHAFLAEGFPHFKIFMGPGAMAAYLGCKPIFGEDSVWFEKFVDDWGNNPKLDFDEDSVWFKRHYESIKEACRLIGGDVFVDIPDIVENLDILASMRGAENLCFDIMDNPEIVKKLVEDLDNLYFEYYDRFYDLVKTPTGESTYNGFHIWSEGKVAKLQCDFSAIISEEQYREFVQNSIKKQCMKLDNSLYHLDGVDAIRHLDAILEIDELDALQWTPGAGKADGLSEEWYPIYDKVRSAGKSLWILVSEYDSDYWVDATKRLIKRYGNDGIYIIYPDMEMDDAEKLLRNFC